MKCPKCKDKSEVIATEAGAAATRRRRRCLNPGCNHRFVTYEKHTPEASSASITTESVMASFNLRKGRSSRFDAEAVAAAIAVDKRRAQLRRELRERERAEWDDGFDPAPERLDRGSLRREIEGY